MFCGCGQHLQSPAQCCQWWDKKKMGPCSFAAANCFPWSLALNTCSNSSGRGLIPLSSSERRAEPPASLCQRGVCAAVPALLLAGVHRCTGDVGLPGRGQGLWLLYVGWGDVSPLCPPSPLEAEGSLSDILRDAFQAVHSLLLAQHRKQ